MHSSKLYNGFQIAVSALAVFSGGYNKGMNQRTCFVAGTMIHTVAGLVAIENIKAGDKVLSTNPETMETVHKSVLETYIRKVDKLVYLTIAGALIITTVDHPFYVKNQDFIAAAELQVGYETVDSNGNVLLVEDIRIENTETTTVYNFQVEDFHTYHVSELGVLVHNAGADYKDVNIEDFEIKNKHLDESSAKRARKFNVDSQDKANKIVQDALKSGKVYDISDNGIGTQGQKSYSAIIDTGKVIGTKGETFIKIVYDELGNVWTTYPVPNP